MSSSLRLLLPAELLSPTPSARGSPPVDARTEAAYRAWACELCAEAAVQLELPAVVGATAATLVQRFYFRRSLRAFDGAGVAAAATFLAAKVEEAPRRMRDVLNVFHAAALRRRRGAAAVRPPVLGGGLYARKKAALVRTERILLKELGFSLYDLQEHPHKFILYYVAALGGSRALADRAWAVLNDSLRADLCVRFRAEAIACAAIALAARSLGEPLPAATPWWRVFSTSIQDIDDISARILDLYARPPPPWLPSLRPGADEREEDEDEADLPPPPLPPPPPPPRARSRSRSRSREREGGARPSHGRWADEAL